MNFPFEIYLDNSSTTKPSDAVIKEISEVLKKNYGNPSSSHARGIFADKIIKKTKTKISEILGSKEDEIYFTSGGTEANNLAIFGSIQKKKGRIVTTAIEHSSIIASCKKLEESNYEVIYLKPFFDTISIDHILNAINKNTLLVSMMMINNEIGMSLPVEKVKKIINAKAPNAIFHIDASQSFCKIKTNVQELKCDLMTITAHKIHGPKGIGALFCSEKIKLHPMMVGGNQQKGIRPGTESTPLIAGFCKAVEEYNENDYEKVKKIYNLFKNGLLSIQGVLINSKNKNFPYIINISIQGVKSEILINFLSSKNIFISNSSACYKNKKSYVLKAMGLSDNLIDSSVRIGFSKFTTEREVLYFLKILKLAINKFKNRLSCETKF